jgi:hypothetical protein
MVTFAFPEFVIVMSLLWLLLTGTLPKFKLLSLTVNLTDSSTPVPLKFTVAGDSLALVLIETVPFSVPAAIGLNATLKVALDPAASFVGAPIPDRLNPVPTISALKIFSSLVPVFDTLIVCGASVFTVTLPKVAADGVMLSARVLPPESPIEPHPESVSPAAIIAMGMVKLAVKRRIPRTDLNTQKPPNLRSAGRFDCEGKVRSGTTGHKYINGTGS